jgi:uncharacterized protein YecT (DUF1311 family)
MLMKCIACWLAVPDCNAQTSSQNVSPEQLQALLNLPLTQAVQRREIYKAPLRAAYQRQTALIGKDCSAEVSQGQQNYNICMGKADAQADQDYANFYNNLQMLCRDQGQLKSLQVSETSWLVYRDYAMHAANAAWPEGTGAPGFAAEVYLFLVRDRMRELYEIYGLNIAQ